MSVFHVPIRLGWTTEFARTAPGSKRCLIGFRQFTTLAFFDKRTRSQGPSLPRRYPASTVLSPCPTPVWTDALQHRCGRYPRPLRVSPACAIPCLDVPRPLPRWTPLGASVGCFPTLCCLPRSLGGSAFTTSLSRPTQASHTLRPVDLLRCPRQRLSQGFDTASYPTAPPASYRANRPSPGWDFHPQGDRALRGAPKITKKIDRSGGAIGRLCLNLRDLCVYHVNSGKSRFVPMVGGDNFLLSRCGHRQLANFVVNFLTCQPARFRQLAAVAQPARPRRRPSVSCFFLSHMGHVRP
jgi:hypothetical protein